MIARMPKPRTVNPVLPAATGHHRGLAYTLWMPDSRTAPTGGVAVLHGAGSCKESHHDFARVAIGAGLAAIVFDQRGHGDSEGPMDGRAVDDVAAMADLLRDHAGGPQTPVALRGSSMGGYLAIVAAQTACAEAVVAICPASAEGLTRGVRAGVLNFDADVEAVSAVLASHDLERSVRELQAPLLIMHAEGDEQVPVEHSRELAKHLPGPPSRLITLPGGHHRSIQHDEEMQAVSVRFILQSLDGTGERRRS